MIWNLVDGLAGSVIAGAIISVTVLIRASARFAVATWHEITSSSAPASRAPDTRPQENENIPG